MRVILNEDIEHIGQRGDVKNVAPGFARNYLLPKGLAYEETEANLARFRQDQKKWETRTQKEKAEAETAAQSIVGLALTASRRAGDEGVLFGSVTAADIAAMIAEKGTTVDKRRILLNEPIKRLGKYQVPIHLHREVSVEISVEVLPVETA